MVTVLYTPPNSALVLAILWEYMKLTFTCNQNRLWPLVKHDFTTSWNLACLDGFTIEYKECLNWGNDINNKQEKNEKSIE